MYLYNLKTLYFTPYVCINPMEQDSNLAHWTALENRKEGIDFELLTVF